MANDIINEDDSIRIYVGNECTPSSISTKKFKVPYLDSLRPLINEARPDVYQKPNRFKNRVDDRLQWMANSSEIARFNNNLPTRQGEVVFAFFDSSRSQMSPVRMPKGGDNIDNGFIIPVSSITSRVIGAPFDLGLFEYTHDLVAGASTFKYVGKNEQLVVLHGHFEFFIRADNIPKFTEAVPDSEIPEPIDYAGYAELSFAPIKFDGPGYPVNNMSWCTVYRTALASLGPTFKIAPDEWYTEYESGEFINKDPLLQAQLDKYKWVKMSMTFHRDVIFEPGTTYGLRLWFWRQYIGIDEEGNKISSPDWPVFLGHGIHLNNASMSFAFDATQDVAEFINDRMRED